MMPGMWRFVAYVFVQKSTHHHRGGTQGCERFQRRNVRIRFETTIIREQGRNTLSKLCGICVHMCVCLRVCVYLGNPVGYFFAGGANVKMWPARALCQVGKRNESGCRRRCS